MNSLQNVEENIFKLLIPAIEPLIAGTKTIELCGKPWTLVDFEQLSDAPPYTCISYTWGTGKTISPLNNTLEISDRTIPVIETVINSFESDECLTVEIRSLFHNESRIAEKLALVRNASDAIWIDALCRPEHQPSADICIQNMGKIYSEASKVFSVLRDDCIDSVRKMHYKESLNLNDYQMVGDDDWIDRVWTYQEFVNSKMMFFVAEGKGDTFISELNFLNALMSDAAAYLNNQDIKLIQKLERAQLLMAAQQMEEQSVFQVMAAINRRSISRPDDRINALISVVLDDHTSIIERNLSTPNEYLMRVCEEHNDYSFIFSTNPRSEVFGRTWRPRGDEIVTPVISDILANGSGVSGNLYNTHLQMNNMCRMLTGKSNNVTSAIASLLKADFPKEILERLRQRGFTGCGECLKLEYGYFFPQSPHKRSKDLFVVVSHNLKFHEGAPGLLLRSNGTDINQFCDTGVFIGRAPAISETINVS
jgi:hypothetical protein